MLAFEWAFLVDARQNFRSDILPKVKKSILEHSISISWHSLNYQLRYYRFYIPLTNGICLHFNKLESSSPKNTLCQVWFRGVK